MDKCRHMNARLLLLVLFPWFLSQAVQACSCFGPQTFCGTLHPEFEEPQWWIPSDVVLVVKLADHEYAADVKVVRSFSGQLQQDEVIRVWGDCGLLCRHYVNVDDGDTLLWALQPCDLSGNGPCGTNFEEPGDYQLSVCGIYWLGFANDVVSGPLTIPGSMQTMDLLAFQDLVDGCLSLGVSSPAEEAAFTIRSNGGVPIIEADQAPGLRFSVFSMSGELARQHDHDGSPWSLDGLAPGVYIVSARRGASIVRQRAVVTSAGR